MIRWVTNFKSSGFSFSPNFEGSFQYWLSRSFPRAYCLFLPNRSGSKSLKYKLFFIVTICMDACGLCKNIVAYNWFVRGIL
jgi:hypothetical protein